jgi:predicted nucleic acid-binding protein
MGLIVVDTSALLPLFVLDEDKTYIRLVLRQGLEGEILTTPSLCIVEFGNCILKATRQKRLSDAEAASAHSSFALFPIRFSDFVQPAVLPAIHELTQRRSLTFYDATYLALALNRGARLASLDVALKEAARAEGVALV